jgi:hypothetical protein
MSFDFVPFFMRCKPQAPKLPKEATAAEKAEFEASARAAAEAAKKSCKEKAKYVNAVPLWGQAAYAAAIAACEAIDWTPPKDDVFGPVHKDPEAEARAAREAQIIAEEVARGAPPAPKPPPILDASEQQKKAYANALPRWERSYSQWKIEDVERAIPTLSIKDYRALSAEQKKQRAENVARLAVMAERVCISWVRSVLQAKAAAETRQMAEGPTLVQRLGALGFYEYVALGLAAALAAAAAVFATQRRPRRTS